MRNLVDSPFPFPKVSNFIYFLWSYYLLGAALKHIIPPALSETSRSLNQGPSGIAVCPIAYKPLLNLSVYK